MNPVPAHVLDRPAPDFGRRLTQAEFEWNVMQLNAESASLPTDEEEARRSQIELHMLVDYRLGVDFPLARRRRLWQAKQRLDKHPVLVLVWGFLTRPWDPGTGLFGIYARAFATVLTPDEIRAFFDVSEHDAKLLRLPRRKVK
jgi:hypothetical protein